MSNDLKWMISSDQQIPYHDPRMISLWFKVMKWFKPDVVDYVGDQSDQACWSRWTDNTSSDFLNAIPRTAEQPVQPFVFDQEKPVREFYEQTRGIVKDAEMFVALGNHDIRVWPYFDKKMPEILSEITPESLWGFDTLGIDYIYYKDKPKHRYGDIYVHHGVSISKHAGESVRNDVDNFGVSIVRGHSHRMAQFNKSFPLRNEIVRGYEVGHMMDTDCLGSDYENVKNWQMGFAVGHIESGIESSQDGFVPHIQLVQVSQDYTCFVDGKKFSA